jgi:GNAT superfamily N-acetyltransferase
VRAGASGDILRCVSIPARDVRASLFEVLESYYDTVPRANAAAEELGPFTLFVKRDPTLWDYYARPRLGLDRPVGADDVRRMRERQRELGIPESFEWVHETTRSLLPAAREAGLAVHECPLLVLGQALMEPVRVTAEVRVMGQEAAALDAVAGAVHAGFENSDEIDPRSAARQADLMERGLLAMVGAFDAGEAVGGGSHSPRGGTTELMGIAVVPHARRRGIGAAIAAALVDDARARGVQTVFLSAEDDAVARVYERVGFERIGTACIAEPR